MEAEILKTIELALREDRAGHAVFNQDRRSFRKARFQLQRKWTDLPGFCTFHSRLLAYVGYESLLAVPLHRLLYRFREPFY